MSVKIVAVSAALLLMTSVAINANQSKFDKSVQKAATDIAAAQLGDIRGSIDHDQKPVMVKSKKELKSQVEPSIPSQPAWTPEPENNKLPPVTQHVEGLDNTATGSIEPLRQPKPLIQLWERFDQNGNRVNRYGNRLN